MSVARFLQGLLSGTARLGVHSRSSCVGSGSKAFRAEMTSGTIMKGASVSSRGSCGSPRMRAPTPRLRRGPPDGVPRPDMSGWTGVETFHTQASFLATQHSSLCALANISCNFSFFFRKVAAPRAVHIATAPWSAPTPAPQRGPRLLDHLSATAGLQTLSLGTAFPRVALGVCLSHAGRRASSDRRVQPVPSDTVPVRLAPSPCPCL